MSLNFNLNFVASVADSPASVSIPSYIRYICITASAGGGAGSIGGILDETLYAGGGGGSGACVQNYFLKMDQSKQTVLVASVGAGGSASGDNGEDSVISVYEDEQLKFSFVLQGGFGAVQNQGGVGGVSTLASIYSGAAGADGQISDPSFPNPVGGKGGNCLLAYGGDAELPGTFGGGGGGGVEAFGAGGDGIVYVYMLI